jgi:hypothetical protein
MVAAESEGVPYIVLLPNIYPLPAPGMPPPGLGLQPARGPLGRIRDHVIRTVTVRTMDAKGLPAINALRTQHNLPPLQHLWDQMRRAERQLVLTAPEFDFPGDVAADRPLCWPSAG